MSGKRRRSAPPRERGNCCWNQVVLCTGACVCILLLKRAGASLRLQITSSDCLSIPRKSVSCSCIAQHMSIGLSLQGSRDDAPLLESVEGWLFTTSVKIEANQRRPKTPFVCSPGGTRMLAIYCLGNESCSCTVKARQQDKGVLRYLNNSMPSVSAASMFLEVRPRPRLLAGPWRQRRV